ncbi:CYFA0S28e00342g1_1 [Cyberlindnera fabianii]|uniref:Peptide hydrolase n=1 Tax=Cyberlindnera fabianii TaxID=36022 RepID=A0A061BAX9_CYBFA|nr:CYFA0S28e00342g1_1 [Cyberlindnera fabianii]
MKLLSTGVLLSLVTLDVTAFHVLDALHTAQSLLPSFSLDVADRLIVTSDTSAPITVSEREKLRLKRSGVNFFDVTEHKSWFFTEKEEVVVPKYNYPVKAVHSEQVESLIENIDKEKLHDNLAEFSSFFSRYYKSESGRESAVWLLKKLKTLVKTRSDLDVNVTLAPFHHDWTQFSTIVSIKGSKRPDDIVVVGCHQDSTNLLFPTLMKAPGADDDGSGVTTNLEALRILLSNGFAPENTVEFHFYSAEEGGLLGSLDIFNWYKKQQKKVVAMLQQDMTGYVQKTLDNGIEEHVGVIDDNVNPELTEFVKLVIDTYLSIPWRATSCGYACSDHASALKNGYPSSFIIESEFKYTSPYIHSTGDTLDRLSFDHIAEFTKLVLGYTVELGNHEFEIVKE